MNRGTIRRATVEDIAILAATMRPSDIRDCMAAALLSPEEAVSDCIRRSEDVWSAWLDGDLVCMFGVTKQSLMSTVATPWMLGTVHMDDHHYSRPFIKQCRQVIRAIHDKYGYLENYVDARNARTIRWLRWMGFEIGPAEPYGVLQRDHHIFIMR